MNFSITTKLNTRETRAAFDQFLQEELAALSPEEGVKKLYSDEPEQLSFHFDIPKK